MNSLTELNTILGLKPKMLTFMESAWKEERETVEEVWGMNPSFYYLYLFYFVFLLGVGK